jgi:glycosyltransferase involved in cell wall biosynthesis
VGSTSVISTTTDALVSVVIPVYGNAADLRAIHARLSAAAGAIAPLECEFVFVDDGSADESFEVLVALAGVDRRVRVLGLSRNFGSNAAILAGLGQANGDAVMTLAADLQDPPELLPELVQAWRAGAQVVLAARRKREDPLPGKLLASAFNRLFRLLVFPQFPKGGFDLVLLDRVVVDTILAMPEKNSYLFGQVLWVGFRRATILYDRAARQTGRSAWTLWRKVKYFIDAFTAFSYLPVRAASLLGLLLAGLGFAYAALVVVMRLRGDIVEPRGFSALLVVVLVTAGAQLVVAGLTGEYLWRVLEEVRPRPPFVIARRINAPPGKASGARFPERGRGPHEER